MVRNPPSNAGHMGSIPSQGTKIPHAAGRLSLHATAREPAHPEAGLRSRVQPVEKACVAERAGVSATSWGCSKPPPLRPATTNQTINCPEKTTPTDWWIFFLYFSPLKKNWNVIALQCCVSFCSTILYESAVCIHII